MAPPRTLEARARGCGHARTHSSHPRRFEAQGPDRLWVADITYVPTWDGFVYLAIVLDAWSRRVVGWAIGERIQTDLVLSALNMALAQRRPRGVIHHSDQGSQYTALEFGRRCKQMPPVEKSAAQDLGPA